MAARLTQAEGANIRVDAMHLIDILAEVDVPILERGIKTMDMLKDGKYHRTQGGSFVAPPTKTYMVFWRTVMSARPWELLEAIEMLVKETKSKSLPILLFPSNILLSCNYLSFFPIAYCVRVVILNIKLMWLQRNIICSPLASSTEDAKLNHRRLLRKLRLIVTPLNAMASAHPEAVQAAHVLWRKCDPMYVQYEKALADYEGHFQSESQIDDEFNATRTGLRMFCSLIGYYLPIVGEASLPEREEGTVRERVRGLERDILHPSVRLPGEVLIIRSGKMWKVLSSHHEIPCTSCWKYVNCIKDLGVCSFCTLQPYCSIECLDAGLLPDYFLPNHRSALRCDRLALPQEDMFENYISRRSLASLKLQTAPGSIVSQFQE